MQKDVLLLLDDHVVVPLLVAAEAETVTGGGKMENVVVERTVESETEAMISEELVLSTRITSVLLRLLWGLVKVNHRRLGGNRIVCIPADATISIKVVEG